MKELIKLLLREGLTLKNDTKDILDDITDEKIGEEEYEKWKYSDGIGDAFGDIKMINGDRVASIIQMNSQPISSRYTDDFKRRGFFTKLVSELKGNDVNKISISMQSRDTRAAVKRLLDKGILKNPSNYRGVSVDVYPTEFNI